jgi:hypothetical protein
MNATPRTAVPGRRPENRQGTNRVARAGLEAHAVDGSRPSSGVLPGSCGEDLHLSGATALEGPIDASSASETVLPNVSSSYRFALAGRKQSVWG